MSSNETLLGWRYLLEHLNGYWPPQYGCRLPEGGGPFIGPSPAEGIAHEGVPWPGHYQNLLPALDLQVNLHQRGELIPVEA
uniref:Uncharacterized protein n=1 Tax=viral metagenome TaxID=1070528 RepID=A0A6H1Z6B2_9ZZZZ